MKIDLYLRCAYCYNVLKMKKIDNWNESPHCEKCDRFFNINLIKDEMKIVIEDKEK